MKNNKIFILIEISLAVVAVILGAFMLNQKDHESVGKVAVILTNAEDNRWATLKYGLKMAAKDHQVEMFVVDASEGMTVAEQQVLIQQEIANGADALILQPLGGKEETTFLKNLQKQLPVMLLGESTPLEDETLSLITTTPDNYTLGKTLAEELLKDHADNLTGKTIGLVGTNFKTETMKERQQGFVETLAAKGSQVSWTLENFSGKEGMAAFEKKAKVNIVMALDDASLTTAGSASESHDLKGAIVYGIGHSTEAVYYLDTDAVECLVVPDEFSMGYRSLLQTAKRLARHFGKASSQKVTYRILRRENLFAKENQELLFMMNQ